MVLVKIKNFLKLENSQHNDNCVCSASRSTILLKIPDF